MKPMMMDSVQTMYEGVPIVAAMPPIENRTSGGTPLAIQNVFFQSIVR